MTRLIPILLLFTFALSNAQKNELGKVSLDEVLEKAYPADTTASAAILFKKGKSIFRYRKTGFYMEHEYEFRIKIYKKEGLDWGTFKVPFFTGYKSLNDDFVEFSDAVTYNLENGKVVKTKTGSEGRFRKKLNDLWDEATLVLANVKAGSVIEFKYTLTTEDITEFPAFTFQYEIPVKYCTYNTEMPEYFVYKPVICGFGNVINTAKIVDGSQSYQDENNQSAYFNYRAVSRNYMAVDMPPLKPEPYVDNLENYRSAVKHELELTQFPGEKEKQYATTWEAVALDSYKNKDFGNELRERQYFEQYLDPYIKSDDAPLKKATAVFNYVQRTMAWDKNYGYLVRKGVKKAFAEKTGNVAEINLMLIAMLNHAGISAYPVLISTIENGVAAFPTRTVFNYVIASAEINGKNVLMDATSKNSAPGILPFRDLNWNGWQIMNDGKATQLELVPKSTSKENYTLMAKVGADGTVSGKAKIIKSDYYGYGFREKYKGVNTDDYLQKAEHDFGGIEMSGYSASVPEDATQPVEEKFDFTGSSAEVIGDRIYIDPLLFLTEPKNPFASDNRQLPIYYGFPQTRQYSVSIEIPAGYTIVSMPKAIALATPENVAAFKLNIQQQNNNIQLSVTSEIKQAIIASGFYDTLKTYYGNMLQSENEKIVLRKI